MTDRADTVRFDYEAPSAEAMDTASRRFLATMGMRRSVRAFSPQPIPESVVINCLRAAATAPSGANRQPWHFVAVFDPAVKRRIREAAEAEERAFYAGRAGQEWLDALAPLGTGPDKPFLETAPVVIAVFAQRYGLDAEGSRVKHYYFNESVGIATGLLIAALQHAGLATLTHTPAPMGFLNTILERPGNERPFMLVVAGFAARATRVPVLARKPFGASVTIVGQGDAGRDDVGHGDP